MYVRLPLYPAEHVNTSVLPYACDAACVAVPPDLAEFEGTATALVRPSHVTAAHALSDVANCPFRPHVYVRLPLYPAEHVNTSVLPVGCDAAREAVLPPATVASAFEGVATALVRPSHVTAAQALSDVANCPF